MIKMINIKNLLITTSMASLLLFGCTNNTTNPEEYTPGPEDVKEEQVEDEKVDVVEESDIIENKSKLVAFTNKNFIENYHSEYKTAIENNDVDINTIHNNLIESEIVTGDNDTLLQLMLDVESELNNSLSKDPIEINERNILNEVYLSEDPSDIETFDDVVYDDNVAEFILTPRESNLIILDKRIDEVVTTNNDPIVGVGNSSLVNLVKELHDDFVATENPLEAQSITKIIYENDDYLIAAQPEPKMYLMYQSENIITGFFNSLESQNVQDVFEKHLSN